jgi:predicted GH43/DUF377 family glycosyl hydrolase
MPHIVDDKIYILYSDKPRTFIIYSDIGTSLIFKSYYKTEQTVKCNYGSIRGGCPPVAYSEDEDIWFFHTNMTGKYYMGAYITKGDVVTHITPKPVLTGAPIIFPCGVVKTEYGWLVSMGINDNEIGTCEIPRAMIADNLVAYS